MGSTLPYDGLKMVLEYLDPNRRILLAKYAPSIRATEKIVPLRVDRLIIDHDYIITVNDVTYRMGIHHGPVDEEELPALHAENEEGGVLHDLNVHGFEDEYPVFEKTPGDVFLARIWPTRPVDQWMIGFHKDISMTEELMIRMRQHAGDPSNDDDMREFFKNGANKRHHELYPYLNFRYNKQPHQTIHLTTSTFGRRGTSVHEYDMKLPVAMKKLNHIFFGDRAQVVRVGFFYPGLPLKVLRLPNQFAFRISTLKVDSPSVFPMLEPIFDKSGGPMDSVEVPLEIKYGGNIVYTCQKLILTSYFSDIDKLKAFIKLPNKEVYLTDAELDFGSDEAKQLIEHWQEHGKPVGTCFFVCMEQAQCTQVMRALAEHFGEQFLDEKLTLPISYNSELEICYEMGSPRQGIEEKNYLKLLVAEKVNA